MYEPCRPWRLHWLLACWRFRPRTGALSGCLMTRRHVASIMELAAAARERGREITLYGVDNSSLALKLRSLGTTTTPLCKVTEEAPPLRCAEFVGGRAAEERPCPQARPPPLT